MAIFFLIFSFISIFGIFFFSSPEKEVVFANLRLAFVKTSLIVSVLAAIFTELLSFFGALNSNWISSLWLAVFAVSLTIFFHAIKKSGYSWKKINFNKIILFFQKETFATKLILILCFVAILSLACVAFTTNNNWDSYTYHLPRVEHWIQDKNVDFFPTNNVRQLYLVPFAEYFILNLRLLSESALLVNFVQFVAFLNCLLLTSLIAKLFGLSSRGQLVAIVLALTLPMGIMQATTTQTDITVSFFLIAFVYFGISIIKERRFLISNIFFLGLSFALGILTKSTFLVFAFPFCFVFGIYYIKLFRLKSLYVLFFLIIAFLSLNFPFLNRNYRQFGSLLGPKKIAPYYQANLNEEFGLKPMLSNASKNIGLHLAFPNNWWNEKADQAVDGFHRMINFPLNSDKTSWSGTKYKTVFMLQQDTVGNFFHIILFFTALLIIFSKWKLVDRLVVFCSLALVSGSLLFALLLKWQPWQTRLDLPLFALMAPFIAYAFSLTGWRKVNNAASIFLLIIALGIVFVFDPIKPIFGKESIFLKDNSAYIFDYQTAKKISQKLDENNITNVGLVLGEDSWEWQYWLLSKNKRFENIYFSKDLTKTPNFDPNFRYKAAIIDNINLEISQMSDLIKKKDDVLEISDIDEKTTLVIYKKEQGKLFIY